MGVVARSHLLDPDNLPPRQTSGMSMTSVQRWVMTALAVTTILHLSLGLLIGAAFMPESRPDARVGLVVLAGVTGVFAVAAGFAIHLRSMLTPWLLVGLLPAVIGAFFIL